jgi:hypothetical protein
MTAPRQSFGFEDGLAYLQIDYPPETDDPARVFRAMAKLIDAFHQIDRDLAHAFSPNLEPVLLLERVEAGSLRAWIRTVVRQMDDDALRNLDWKPLVGQYLVRGKHAFLRWLDDKEHISNRSELLQLQASLAELNPSEPADVLLIEPVPAAKLLHDARLLVAATEDLRDTDIVTYVSDADETKLSRALQLSSEEVESLLTDEVVRSNTRTLLLIKKPDYLGASRWEFRLADRPIEAKILDEAWLARFREGQYPLRPADALDADVRSELFRGFEGNVVGTHYFVEHIYRVVHGVGNTQEELDFE